MCAVFGIHDYSSCFNSRNKNIILSVLSQECQVRGTDATGIAYVKNNRVQIYKRPFPAHKMRYNLPRNIKTIMGHTRMTTQGSEKNNYNNHPFFGRVKHNKFALAHNGILHNDTELRQSLHLPKTQIETDSYVAVQIIEKENRVTLDSLCKMAESVRGSFVFTVLDCRNNLYFVKGDNPICIYHFADNGFYLYASTEEILQKSLVRMGIDKCCHQKIDVNIGDILRIDSNGDIDRSKFKFTECFTQRYMHYPYFDDYGFETVDSHYLSILKQTARAVGYTSSDIDTLMAEGWSLDEIEQIIYDDIDYIYGTYESETELCFERMGVQKS